MRTSEQREADENLRKAIDRALHAYDLFAKDALLVDYVIVAEGQRYEEDEDEPREQFGLLFHNGYCRTTVAVGLLDYGKYLLKEGERADDGS